MLLHSRYVWKRGCGELLRFCVKSEGCRSPKVDFSDSLFCGRGAGVGRILFFLYAYFYCNFLISFFLEKSIELFPHGKEHLYIPAYHLIKLSVCFFETQMFSFYDSVLVIIPVYMYNAAYKYRHTHARTHAGTHAHLWWKEKRQGILCKFYFNGEINIFWAVILWYPKRNFKKCINDYSFSWTHKWNGKVQTYNAV